MNFYSAMLRNTSHTTMKNTTDLVRGEISTKPEIILSDTDYLCNTKNETTLLHWSNDPLFYIITVLMFYALSIIILMVKYIRRERQEAEYDNYYYEFVTREKFQTPQFKNTQNMSNVLKSMQYTKLTNHDNAQGEKESKCKLSDLNSTQSLCCELGQFTKVSNVDNGDGDNPLLEQEEEEQCTIHTEQVLTNPSTDQSINVQDNIVSD